MWIITGRLNDVATSCARRSTSKSFAPATSRDSRALTPAMKSRFFAIASRAAPTSARLEVHRVAFGQDAGAPDVDQNAALLRRRFARRQSFRRCDRRLAIPRRSTRSRRPAGTSAGPFGEARRSGCGCRSGPGRRACRARRWFRRRRPRCWPRPPRCGLREIATSRIASSRTRRIDDAPALDDQVIACREYSSARGRTSPRLRLRQQLKENGAGSTSQPPRVCLEGQILSASNLSVNKRSPRNAPIRERPERLDLK